MARYWFASWAICPSLTVCLVVDCLVFLDCSTGSCILFAQSQLYFWETFLTLLIPWGCGRSSLGWESMRSAGYWNRLHQHSSRCGTVCKKLRWCSQSIELQLARVRFQSFHLLIQSCLQLDQVVSLNCSSECFSDSISAFRLYLGLVIALSRPVAEGTQACRPGQFTSLFLPQSLYWLLLMKPRLLEDLGIHLSFLCQFQAHRGLVPN